METNVKELTARSTYWKLDGFLLRLAFVELIYFSAWILASIVAKISDEIFANNSARVISNFVYSVFTFVPLLVVFSLGLVGGVCGFFLHDKGNVRGYAGTGHIVNWVFISVMGLFMAAIFYQFLVIGID